MKTGFVKSLSRQPLSISSPTRALSLMVVRDFVVPLGSQFSAKGGQRPKRDGPRKDPLDLSRLGGIRQQLSLDDIVAHRRHAAHPDTFGAAGGDFVAHTLTARFPLELREGQQDVQGQAPDAGGGERLRHGDGSHLLRVERFDKFPEIGQRAGQAVDLEDDDHIEITYEQVTGDLGGVNCSSIRGGLLEFHRRCETRRSEAISSFGYDPEDIKKEIASDKARADALGLQFDSDPPHDRRAAPAGIAVIPIHGTLVRRTLGLDPASGLTGEIGAMPDAVLAWCSPEFFEMLRGHPKVEEAYENWQQGVVLINDMRAGVTFGGLTCDEYRGRATDANGVSWRFIDAGEGHRIQPGTIDTFGTYAVPADFNEMNTLGQPLHAKQEAHKFDRSSDLHTQSHPLPDVPPAGGGGGLSRPGRRRARRPGGESEPHDLLPDEPSHAGVRRQPGHCAGQSYRVREVKAPGDCSRHRATLTGVT